MWTVVVSGRGGQALDGGHRPSSPVEHLGSLQQWIKPSTSTRLSSAAPAQLPHLPSITPEHSAPDSPASLSDSTPAADQSPAAVTAAVTAAVPPAAARRRRW